MTTAEKLRAEGRAEGALRARREMLLEQLAARFGELPNDTRRRVEEAGVADLERWGVSFATAASLDEVFADPA